MRYIFLLLAFLVGCQSSSTDQSGNYTREEILQFHRETVAKAVEDYKSATKPTRIFVDDVEYTHQNVEEILELKPEMIEQVTYDVEFETDKTVIKIHTKEKPSL